MPSTETSIDRSIMSSAKRAMQRACCWHGSGSPLTAMYLSPTVSTCQRHKVGALMVRRVRESERGTEHGSRVSRYRVPFECPRCVTQRAPSRRPDSGHDTIGHRTSHPFAGALRQERNEREHYRDYAGPTPCFCKSCFGFSIQPVTSLTTLAR